MRKGLRVAAGDVGERSRGRLHQFQCQYERLHMVYAVAKGSSVDAGYSVQDLGVECD